MTAIEPGRPFRAGLDHPGFSVATGADLDAAMAVRDEHG